MKSRHSWILKRSSLALHLRRKRTNIGGCYTSTPAISLQCLLSYPISNSLEDEWNRDDAAAYAVIQYCDVLEGGPLRCRLKRETTDSAASDVPLAQPQDALQGQDGISACEVKRVTVHGKSLRATQE
ncbi:hypothetical protein BDW72DRAFT_187829 [Aspergillus terricola var. indicus]